MEVIIDGVAYSPRIQADVGGRIKSLSMLFCEGRKHHGFTIKQAAKKAGVAESRITAAECGTVSLQTAVALSDLYGIPMDQIARAARRTPEEALIRSK